MGRALHHGEGDERQLERARKHRILRGTLPPQLGAWHGITVFEPLVVPVKARAPLDVQFEVLDALRLARREGRDLQFVHKRGSVGTAVLDVLSWLQALGSAGVEFFGMAENGGATNVYILTS